MENRVNNVCVEQNFTLGIMWILKNMENWLCCKLCFIMTACFLVDSMPGSIAATGLQTEALGGQGLYTQAAGEPVAQFQWTPQNQRNPPAGQGTGRQTPQALWCPIKTKWSHRKNSGAPWAHWLVNWEYLPATGKSESVAWASGSQGTLITGNSLISFPKTSWMIAICKLNLAGV